MSSTQVGTEQQPVAATVDLKLEVVVIPVSDVDRAKRFYADLGWRLDGDFVVGDAFRGIQMTPPGSPAVFHALVPSREVQVTPPSAPGGAAVWMPSTQSPSNARAFI